MGGTLVHPMVSCYLELRHLITGRNTTTYPYRRKYEVSIVLISYNLLQEQLQGCSCSCKAL